MQQIILVTCLAMLAYVYLGYPLLCGLLAGLRRRRVRSAEGTPEVSIIISAYNEAQEIASTIKNKLELDYPRGRLEIIVVSDGSDDGTDEVVKRIAETDPSVRIIRQEPRAGKTSALNIAAGIAHAEILVFSDANSLYAPDALRRLVEPFADPDVGYVTGRMLYRAADGSMTGEGCSAYMYYENLLRGLETAIGSVVGTDGGIDAIRADLYVRMRNDQLPDFILPLSVIERGRRVVFAPGARLYEMSLSRGTDEFRMRSRVTLRALHALREKLALMNPFRFGLYSWQLLSHKWLRYLAPIFQIGALASNASLLGSAPIWDTLLLVQVVFYSLALLGFVGFPLPPVMAFPYYLCLLNAAAGTAWVRFLRGEKQVIWKPRT